MPARFLLRSRAMLAGAALLAAFAAAIAFPGPARAETQTASSNVVVVATAEDWIGVADASGHMILGRLLHQGDKLTLPGGSGLVFTAGNAGATTLLVDGRQAPPLGTEGEVVRDQPLDPALLAAGKLPAQLAAARIAAAAAPKSAAKNSQPQPSEAPSEPARNVAVAPSQKPEQEPTPDAGGSGAGRIVVAASADDWISVTDASGHMVLGRLLHQGDKLALPEGSGDFFTTGNAGATTLLVDGRQAPPLGGNGEVVSNQPLDPALIAAGRLPAQREAANRSVAPAVRAVAAAAHPAAAPVPQPNEVAAPPAPKVAATPDANRAETGRIVIAASADDWISVTDASGHVILARLLHKGEKLALPEGSGLNLTAGNAGATTLLVDGRQAPPLGGNGEVVSNQPLDSALIAAGRLPAQLGEARIAVADSPAAAPPAKGTTPPAPALLRPVAMVVPVQSPEPGAAPAPPVAKPTTPLKVAPFRPAGVQRSGPFAGPAMAVTQPAAARPADPRSLGATIALRSGSGQVVNLSVPAASVFTADPKVADVRPASPTSLFVLGVAPGETTIAALDQAGHPIAQYRVIVTPSAFGPDAAAAAIGRLMPGAQIRLSALPDGITVSGTVATAADAAEIMELVQGFLGPKEVVHDELSVLSDVQVSLQVRVAEMSRTVTRELGVNWQNLGTTGGKITANFMAPSALAFLNAAQNTFNFAYHSGHTDVNSIIDALAQDQLARLLAEPNLTAMSGQTASFLVGGEFPIPVSLQNGSISVQFQPYGVSLSFIPTVLADNRISLRVRPEVSELTNQGAVQLSEGNSTIQIPALLVRRAETTVELGSGQSFAIAGLLQDQATQVDQGLPGLSEVPILGALFNSNSFQRQETELVIVVTPYIVRPVSRPSLLRLPTDNWSPPNDLERILFHRQVGQSGATAPVARIPGDAGFIAQ